MDGVGFGLQVFVAFYLTKPVIEPLGHNAVQGFVFIFIEKFFRELDSGGFGVAFFHAAALDLHTGDAVYENADNAAGQAQELLYFDERTDVINVLEGRFFYFVIELGRDEQHPVVLHGVIDGSEGFFPAYVDVAEQFWKNDDSP